MAKEVKLKLDYYCRHFIIALQRLVAEFWTDGSVAVVLKSCQLNHIKGIFFGRNKQGNKAYVLSPTDCSGHYSSAPDHLFLLSHGLMGLAGFDGRVGHFQSYRSNRITGSSS